MPLITQLYDPNKGPYLDVFISKPKSITFRQDEIDESTRKLTMLLDTGASKSAVSPAIAVQMGLLPMGKTPLKSATSTVEANIFYVDMRCDILSPPFTFPDMKVVEFQFAPGWIDGFLGRDFFEKVVFTLNGPEKSFSIVY